MYPRLFTIGPFTIYSYGLMLGVGFILASIFLTKELRRKQLDPALGSTITLLAIVFGIAGSKLLYLLENWEYFARDPLGMAFSPGGLTWYGGFILATLAIMVYVRRRKIPFLKICDAASPSLLIGYGVARLGCHLSGDGDYGIPTDLPWSAVYSNGTYPPSIAFRNFPEIVQKYGVNGVVPDTIPVHPTPVYEFIAGVLLFIILWNLRKKLTVDGSLFMVYLVMSGGARFLVEFIRLNPRILFGLSEAQLLSMVMVALGVAGFFMLSKNLGAAPR
ncbi:MAG: hypothetical protein AUI33_16445 [Ignavibacteria bacterium 13_1_40CM_2_61_4]|nr:MAG: hypothetical protein AUI33_16445 [Ignavibacteria bacterium 13_1_40CM_2_61_4]